MKSKNRIATEQASAYVEEQYKKIKENEFRQGYHFEPPAGWCNDPNGFCFYKGKYHLFYQHMPYTPTPGDYVMCWGHAVSEDLIKWTHLPVALAPVDEYDSAGCWSGCAFEYEGKMALMYTGRDARKSDKQIQCMAISDDEIHFEKYKENPILPGPLCDDEGENFRDPCIWRHEDEWYMVVGSSKEGFGRVLLYKSKDLKTWKYVNNLVESLGELGTVCECPNFFQLEGKYVLFISPHGLCKRKSIYLTGDFDYKTGRFFWNNYGEIDWGMDFYAPQVLKDNKDRWVMIGWMNSWNWMPWCDGKYFTSQWGWCGGMSLPRELSLRDDGKLVSKPLEELRSLRKSCQEYTKTVICGQKSVDLKTGDRIQCELKAKINLGDTNADQIIFLVKDDTSHKVEIILDLKKGELVFDRTNTLDHLKSKRKCNLAAVSEKETELHIYFDVSSIEIFADNYTTNMTNTMYLSRMRSIEIAARGGEAVFEKIELWDLQ